VRLRLSVVGRKHEATVESRNVLKLSLAAPIIGAVRDKLLLLTRQVNVRPFHRQTSLLVALMGGLPPNSQPHPSPCRESFNCDRISKVSYETANR
jgi:hypothetical protein